VNNLHIITLYKLHNKLSWESSVSSRAVQQDWHSHNALARYVERVVSRRDEPSGIWAILPRVLIS